MKLSGNDFRLFVGTGNGSGAQPKGQGDLTIERGKAWSSNATKDQEGVDTQQPGLRTITVKQAIIPDLPDADGYERLEELDKTNEPEIFEIRKKPWADETSVIFRCSMYVSLDSSGYGQGASVATPFTLVPAENPTVDKLK
jgi:hypothetical protein